MLQNRVSPPSLGAATEYSIVNEALTGVKDRSVCQCAAPRA